MYYIWCIWAALCASSGFLLSIYHTDELTIQIIYYSGWLQRQCHWLQDDLSAQAGRHQGQQAWHEPHALRCQGEEEPWDGQMLTEENTCETLLSCYVPKRLCNWFILLLHLFTHYRSASFIFLPQQAEDIDVELLTFPSQLEHIGMASRWLSLVHWQSNWWFNWTWFVR